MLIIVTSSLDFSIAFAFRFRPNIAFGRAAPLTSSLSGELGRDPVPVPVLETAMQPEPLLVFLASSFLGN